MLAPKDEPQPNGLSGHWRVAQYDATWDDPSKIVSVTPFGMEQKREAETAVANLQAKFPTHFIRLRWTPIPLGEVVQDIPDEPQSVSLNAYAAAVHDWAKRKGWWEEGERNFGELLMLVVTEVAEAYEEWRNGHAVTEIYYAEDKYGVEKPEGVPIELIDVFIRLADLFGFYGIDADEAARIKMAYNETRPHRHGGKRA